MTADVIFELWPKQAALIHSEATEILWGGAAGPGKSHGSRVASIAWCLAIPGLQVGLFRREYRDLISNHMQGPTGFPSLLAPVVEAGHAKITEKCIKFNNGSAIHLCHCQHEKDVFGWQGSEFHVLILEEATQFSEFQIRYLRSRVRMSDAVKVPAEWAGKFPRIIYPTNPGGVGHSYLKRAMWEPAQKLLPLATWRAADDDGGFLRQFIPAKLTDNPSVNPDEYAKRLKGIGSPEYVRALLEGDWSVIVGAFFSELGERHRIPDINPPDHLLKFAWYDWGYGQPAACLFFFVADGEGIQTRSGEMLYLPRGALVAFKEVYFCSDENPALGSRTPNVEQARRILSAAAGHNIAAYFSDSKPFQSTGGAVENPAKEMAAEGLLLRLANTSDRVAAWSMTHSRLQNDPALLYFCHCCVHTWRTMQALQTALNKPEDADTDGEDHLPDCVKGACTVRKVIRDREEPQAEMIQRAWGAKPTMSGILKQNGVGWASR